MREIYLYIEKYLQDPIKYSHTTSVAAVESNKN